MVPWTERENSLLGTPGLIPGHRIPEALRSSPRTSWTGPARTSLAADEQGMVGALDSLPLKTPILQPVSLQSNWLVPFLLPFHPFLFIFFIFIFHLKCFFSHAFPSSEACYRSHVSLSSLYVWPFCIRFFFFPVFVCLPPLSRLPSPLFVAIFPKILLLSLQGREF